jgi:tetratricopeptide (TPR) repeat protein
MVEPMYQEDLLITKAALGEEHPEYAMTLNNFAGLYEAMGAYDKAEPMYQEALRIRKAALGEEHPEYATTLSNLAGL